MLTFSKDVTFVEFKEKCIEFQNSIEQKFRDFEADTGMKIGYISRQPVFRMSVIALPKKEE